MGAFSVPQPVAIAAGISALISSVAYFFAPKKESFLFYVSFVVYLSLAITIGYLLYLTGITSSPFIALGMIAIVFSGLFGYSGLGIAAVVVNGFLAFDLIVGHTTFTTNQHFVVYVLGYEIPLLASWLIWYKQKDEKNEKETAYTALANQLNQVANKSEIVINAIGDGVIALNGQGVVELINPAAQKILGWGKQDALQLDYKTLFKLQEANGEPLKLEQSPIEQTLKVNKSVLRNDLVLETKSNKKLSISLLVSPAGQPGAGAIIVFRDITKEKTEEHQQAEFISTASHEMRTPVASIEGYLGLALNPSTANIDDKARMYLTKAHEAAQHLGRLFQDLLDISRLEDGRLVNNPKVVDVVSFTQDIVAGFTLRAKQKGIILLFKPVQQDEAARRLSPVYYANVDNDHLREILSNLIDNAIKYTTKGDVTVNISGDNEHIRVSVSDTGIGIPPEDIPHLFQKFYRVDNTDTREIGGTGLGLYLCRRLIEQMDGRIWVESEQHKGSTFFVELPRLSHEEAISRIEATAATPVKNASSSTAPETPTLDQTPAVAPETPATTVVSPLQPAEAPPLQPTAEAQQPQRPQPTMQPVTTVPPPVQAAPGAPSFASPHRATISIPVRKG